MVMVAAPVAATFDGSETFSVPEKQKGNIALFNSNNKSKEDVKVKLPSELHLSPSAFPLSIRLYDATRFAPHNTLSLWRALTTPWQRAQKTSAAAAATNSTSLHHQQQQHHNSHSDGRRPRTSNKVHPKSAKFVARYIVSLCTWGSFGQCATEFCRCYSWWICWCCTLLIFLRIE